MYFLVNMNDQLLRLEHLDEGFLGDVVLADAFHALFAFFLFLQQFAFGSDVAAVAFRGDVFSQRGNTLPRNNFPADGGLDRDLVKLARNHFFQLRGQHPAAALGAIAMDDGGEGVDRLAVYEQVELHQFRGAITGVLVIHRAVTAGDALNLVVEVDEDFVQRQLAMQHDAPRVERFRVVHQTALLQDKPEDVADVFIRAKHVGFHDRLADFLDHARVGQMRGVIDQDRFAAGRENFVDDARRRGDDVHVVTPRICPTRA